MKSMALKGKKHVKMARSKNLKPAANHSSRMTTRSCTNIRKKRIGLEFEEKKSDKLYRHEAFVRSASPAKNNLQKEVHVSNHQKMPGTPKTPRKVEFDSQSELESLPMDILVKIICNLHHDQLRYVFHVSQRMRCAVLEARQLHFNYTTPDRSRQEMLMTMTPVPIDHWPFMRDHRALTPKAPRQGRRPRVHLMDLKQICSSLFQESTSSKFKMPPGLPKPVYKTVTSPRVLFFEDDKTLGDCDLC